MCGIVGYVGNRSARPIILAGLKRLEYRGYDSAGVATIETLSSDGNSHSVADGDQLVIYKRKGKVTDLEEILKTSISTATVGIGHTRWATHGAPNDVNAHPHLSADGTIAVIHNGIIENFATLRSELEARGVEFISDTDTECTAHLLAEAYTGDLAEAMRLVCRRLS